MDPTGAYLANGTLPMDVKEANQANWFILYDGILYKCSYTRPLLCCMTPEMGQEILEEIHEDVCSPHIGGHTSQSLPSERVIISHLCARIP